jgi:predicted aspartyl protease
MKTAVSLAFAVLALQPAWAEEDCRLQLATSLPLVFDETNRVSVSAAIRERPIELLVDTGAGNTSLRESVVEELDLNRNRTNPHIHLAIRGGIHMKDNVEVNGFTLGRLKADGITFLVIPEDKKLPGLHDGLLGETILSKYDVDFDFAHFKLNLFAPHRCPGKVVYWTQNENLIAKVPFEFNGFHIFLPLQIDGKAMKAILDTGATGTVMSLERDMPKFGLTPQSPGMTPIGHNDTPLRFSYTFKTLTFEGVTVNNPKVIFESDTLSKDHKGEMLLGMDVLNKLHLFIAYKERMLYITAADAK